MIIAPKDRNHNIKVAENLTIFSNNRPVLLESLGLSRVSTLVALCVANTVGYNVDDQIDPDISFGTFQDPSSNVRPRFRYWVPDASVNLNEVANDFALIKEAGLGGMELLGYYLYGNYPSVVAEGGPVPVDWTKYGWGSEAWKALTEVALQATKDHGLIMDFALGPNQGSGVPAEPNDDGVMWNLQPFNISIPIGGSYNGTLPGWGTGEFVSASTALVLDKTAVQLQAAPAFISQNYSGSRFTLASSSLADVTDQVGEDGYISLSFPSSANGTEYQLFAYYQNHTTGFEQQSPLYLNTTVSQSPVTSFLQNGSRFNDHFSTTGAQLIIDFWEKYLLDYNNTRDLIREVGNYGWEDSMEFGNSILVWWTPGLVDAFEKSRGYSICKYLPLIYYPNAQSDAPLASPHWYLTDESDGGQAHVDDYRQTLTELNKIYLQTLTNWTNESLESQYSAQVAYNLPMDMLANIPAVNGPETESLGFNHVIDAYRQFAGPANLAGKRVISSELGAQRNEAYSQTMPELIWDVKRSIAGSVNNFVYHAYPFSGTYPNTTWPGYTTFAYRFSNMHGPRQPTWEYYDDFMNWTARTQYIAQSGIPKIDLAFWLKKVQFFDKASQYHPNDLIEDGWSYEYLSPDNLISEPEAFVSDGILAPARQAFQALILRGNDTLTVAGVDKLKEYADAGLPIIISGGTPFNLSGYNMSGSQYVKSALESLTAFENVHEVPAENLSSSLTSLGLTPRTQVSADRIWYTYWREDAEKDKSYVFVYNDAWDEEFGQGGSSGSVTFETTGVPYFYDAWTGEIKAISAYEQTSTSTTIDFSLAGNQSVIVGFHHNEKAAHSEKAKSSPGWQHNYQTQQSSDNISSILPAQKLTSWSLTIESWSAPEDLYADQTQSSKSNTTWEITELQPWNAISDSLFNVSGRGFYNTTFTWPPADNSDAAGAFLDLGAVINTARAWVNGHQLPPLDPTHAVADMTGFVKDGENEVLVVVATTLGNAVRPHWSQLRSSGTLALGPLPPAQAYGLLSDVLVRTY
ncbi:hypothetical protein Q7P37_002202 [Cladosporium fusiforme]